MKHSKRPVFLNLLQIRFPITAIISIGHRVTGILFILLLPFWMYLLSSVTSSYDSYVALLKLINTVWWMKILLWLSTMCAWYHALAGIRHLIMDFGYAESLSQATFSAYILLFVISVAGLGLGVCLW